MCGIVGVVSNKNANEKLFKGLSNLEYRGYDSVGMCNFNNNFPNNIKFFLNKVKLSNKSNNKTYNNNCNSQKFMNIPNNKFDMNIINFIKFENYYCRVNPLFQKKLKEKIPNYSLVARKVNISRNTISRMVTKRDYWINFRTLLNISKLFNIPNKELYKSISYIKTYNSRPMQFDIKNLNSPQLFRIIGHILGDGGIHVIKNESKYRAFYSNNKDELLNSFEKDIRYLFGKIRLYKRIRKSRPGEIWLPTSLGSILYELMEYKKYGIKRIPSFVYRTKNSELLGYLLQALYDDEGYIYPQKRMIVISQKYKDLVDDIREIVKKVGINPNQIFIHKSKNRTKMYYFSITGKENFLLFDQKIGFLHPIKKEKLKILVGKYRGI